MSTAAGVPAASGASAADTPATIVSQFNAAWGAHDLAAALALTSDDCVFESTSPPDGERCTGRSEIRAAWQPIFDDVGSAFTVEETIEAGQRVIQRWRYDWAEGHVRGVDIFAIRDGKITEKFAYVKG
jgi:ketosteroid isomerase-like protein